jgi:hypothetical protein
MPFLCETPGQSVLVAVAAGLLGGATALLGGLDAVGAAGVAALVALLGELAGHLLGRDAQFEAALSALR